MRIYSHMRAKHSPSVQLCTEGLIEKAFRSMSRLRRNCECIFRRHACWPKPGVARQDNHVVARRQSACPFKGAARGASPPQVHYLQAGCRACNADSQEDVRSIGVSPNPLNERRWSVDQGIATNRTHDSNRAGNSFLHHEGTTKVHLFIGLTRGQDGPCQPVVAERRGWDLE